VWTASPEGVKDVEAYIIDAGGVIFKELKAVGEVMVILLVFPALRVSLGIVRVLLDAEMVYEMPLTVTVPAKALAKVSLAA
jgi:hypothetical protein